MKTVKQRKDYEILEILQDYCQSDLTPREIQRKYSLGSSSQLIYWFRKFVASNIKKVEEMKGENIDIERLSTRNETLEQENARLRKELEREKLRSEGLEIMIDIAEKELRIPIRKKSGAKQWTPCAGYAMTIPRWGAAS